MANERAVAYLRANLGKYPLEALKGVLLKGGITPAEIDEAILAVQGPPPGAAPAPSADSPGDTLSRAKSVLLTPAAFYREMPREGGFKEPLVFLLVMTAASQGVAVVLGLAARAAGFSGGLTAAAILGMGLGVIVSFVFSPIAAAIGAGILHYTWKFLGSTAPFETSFRCVAYMAPLMVVHALAHSIPVIGLWMAVPATLYGVYLCVPASIEAHGVRPETAKRVFGAFAFLAGLASITSVYGAWKLQGMRAGAHSEMRAVTRP